MSIPSECLVCGQWTTEGPVYGGEPDGHGGRVCSACHNTLYTSTINIARMGLDGYKYDNPSVYELAMFQRGIRQRVNITRMLKLIRV